MLAHKDMLTGPFRIELIGFKAMTFTEMDGTKREESRLLCSYCGSLSVEDVLKAFQTSGVKWSGSDWKYGWPHKFYIEIPCTPYRRCTSKGPGSEDFGYSVENKDCYKFYTEHLLDATPEQLAEWNRVVEPITRIGFAVEGDRLKYSAPYHGYQGDGVIP